MMSNQVQNVSPKAQGLEDASEEGPVDCVIGIGKVIEDNEAPLVRLVEEFQGGAGEVHAS